MKYLIEDDYYIVVEPYDYALARYTGVDKKGNDTFKFISYHTSVDKALNAYLDLCIREKLSERDTATIKEMISIISSETKRLSEMLKSCFSEVTNWRDK